MKSLKQYFDKALKEGFAIPQFNFSDFTQVKAIVAVAEKSQSPVILGTSEGESKFFGLNEAVAIRDTLRQRTGLPIFLNLDHGKTFEYLKQVIDAGYDMVHFDGSKLSLAENIEKTNQVIKYAKWRGVLVEGEVGKIGTESSKVYAEKFEIHEADLTNPSDAEIFVRDTKVDLLAVGIGNFHGVQSSGANPDLKIDVLKKIKDNVAGVGLVLHGGSGTPEESVRQAISNGIVKININTELRIAFSEGLRTALAGGEIVPYRYLPIAQAEVEKIVEQKISLFQSAFKV
jgi:fructose-bisphosphate aldolase class II